MSQDEFDVLESLVQRRVFISGKVQGVTFRAAAVSECKKYATIKGFVRNLPDGRVEVLFVGKQPEVLKMLQWCRTGPSGAKVASMEVREEEVNFHGREFKIRYD